MFIDLGLCATIALAGWLALEHLGHRKRAGQSLPIGLLGLGAALWAAGEVAIRSGASPAELAWGRRLYFLGACALPVIWFWIGVQVARPRWAQRWRWLPGLFAAPSIFLYSSLYWDDAGRFVSLVSPVPMHGPWFHPYVAIAYALIVAGTSYSIAAARRLGRAEPRRVAAIAAAALLPISGNLAYLAGGLSGFDPTPLLLSVGGILIRSAVIDSGLLLSLPLARHDVVEQLGVGIAVADLRGLVVDSNPAARRLLGTDPRGESLQAVEARARAARDAVVDVQSMPLTTMDGRVGSALVLTDQTQSRGVERRLQRVARLETIGSLAAGIAHEVNNPLAYIRANLGLIEKYVQTVATPEHAASLPPELREASLDAVESVCETQDGVERIANLVDRLKTFARDTPAEASAAPVDLGWVVRRAATLAGVGPARDAIHIEAGPAPSVLGYESELVQIVLNLLVNATQASGAAPEIVVETAPHPDGAVVRVIDRGSGIAPEALERVFDPFFTTKPAGQGTGLGLSVSYDLARQHGGRLEAANRVGGGAVFSLILPAVEAAGLACRNGPADQSPRRSNT
jgi:signal transduction histidine kinase